MFLFAVEDVADGGGDDVAEAADGVADHRLRHAAEVDLAEEPVDAELGVQVEDLSATWVGPPTMRAPRRAARLLMVERFSDRVISRSR